MDTEIAIIVPDLSVSQVSSLMHFLSLKIVEHFWVQKYLNVFETWVVFSHMRKVLCLPGSDIWSLKYLSVKPDIVDSNSFRIGYDLSFSGYMSKARTLA